MQEEGKVISIKGDRAYVQIDIEKRCCECKICDRTIPIILEANNSIGANVGQRVKLETKLINKVRGIIFFLILPPLLLVFGIIMGNLIANYFNLPDKFAEIIGVILGLLLFCLSVLFAYWLDKLDKKDRLYSEVIEIIGI